MSRNRLEKTWNFWHYSDSSTLLDEADRLYKIRPLLDYLVETFRKHCKPPQKLLLEEAVSHGQGVSDTECIILVNLQSTEY
jgi:hypothetical protein